MYRDVEMALLEFCAAQSEVFDPEAWCGLDARIPRETLAAAAWFLAMNGPAWFGHADALVQVASRLAPDKDFVELARIARFDYQRFGNSLRVRIRHACALS